MTKLLKSLLVAGVLGVASASAQAISLVGEFSGRVTAFNSPPEFADLGPLALQQTFYGNIVIPNYDSTFSGTLALGAEDGVYFSLFAPLLTVLEGDRVNGQPIPDDEILGVGSVTLTAGRITNFTWSMNREQGLASYDRFIQDLGVPVLLDTISVTMGPTSATNPNPVAFSGSRQLGDVWFASTNRSVATIGVISSVPEPETYAMMLAGLGLIGFIGARRMRAVANA